MKIAKLELLASNLFVAENVCSAEGLEVVDGRTLGPAIILHSTQDLSQRLATEKITFIDGNQAFAFIVVTQLINLQRNQTT